MSVLLTLNAGSSSVKFSIYENTTNLLTGQVENLGPAARLVIDDTKTEIGAADHPAALSAILRAAAPTLTSRALAGVGHRIVHGGVEFHQPTILTDDVLQRLAALNPLAPLHQPHNLSMVEAARKAFPDAVQIGCFDTAFHHGHPWVNDTFALPRSFYDEGVRRYGFHGLSYDYITSALARDYPNLHEGRVVVAHLGNGASICAIRAGQSVGSTMGFSALDGLPMGTRCGQLDPGAVLYLLGKGLGHTEIETILYRESGLRGLSGISHDMRTLLASDAPEAAQAIDYYVFRIQRELGAMTAVLGGLDGLVFCGGIGENAAPIRARVLRGMGYLGLVMDDEANADNGPRITSGAIPALVIPTDEESVIAKALLAVLA
ncbi:MAG: acetate/propionate family kinase [Pseudomonadota bacterium]